MLKVNLITILVIIIFSVVLSGGVVAQDTTVSPEARMDEEMLAEEQTLTTNQIEELRKKYTELFVVVQMDSPDEKAALPLSSEDTSSNESIDLTTLTAVQKSVLTILQEEENTSAIPLDKENLDAMNQLYQELKDLSVEAEPTIKVADIKLRNFCANCLEGCKSCSVMAPTVELGRLLCSFANVINACNVFNEGSCDDTSYLEICAGAPAPPADIK